MTPEETNSFLLEGTRTGKLAWVGGDGRPHVAPIWFTLDGDDLIFNTHESSGKAKALRREGRASLVVDDQAPPYSYVKIDGAITFDDDPERLRAAATKIGGRYMGEGRAEEFGARNGGAGELLVRLTPERIAAKAEVSD
jgi:PPOX class probable F420-dependent enzyme